MSEFLKSSSQEEKGKDSKLQEGRSGEKAIESSMEDLKRQLKIKIAT